MRHLAPSPLIKEKPNLTAMGKPWCVLTGKGQRQLGPERRRTSPDQLPARCLESCTLSTLGFQGSPSDRSPWDAARTAVRFAVGVTTSADDSRHVRLSSFRGRCLLAIAGLQSPRTFGILTIVLGHPAPTAFSPEAPRFVPRGLRIFWPPDRTERPCNGASGSGARMVVGDGYIRVDPTTGRPRGLDSCRETLPSV